MELEQPTGVATQEECQPGEAGEARALDGAIEQLERLYTTVTGRPVPAAAEPYAPMPPERDPWQMLQDGMDQLLQLLPAPRPERAAWAPRLSAWQDAQAVVLSFDLPGVTREEVRLALASDVLELSGTRGATNGQHWLWRESPLGRFFRRVRVHPSLAQAAVSSRLENGVLEVRFSGGEAERPLPTTIKID